MGSILSLLYKKKLDLEMESWESFTRSEGESSIETQCMEEYDVTDDNTYPINEV
jgi:hypothetical protein